MIKTSSLQDFLNEIARYPLLTAEQEVLLFRQIKAMEEAQSHPEPQSREDRRAIRVGERAKERFINSNLRMVVNIAKKYNHRTSHLDLMDLINEGTFGLIRAVEKYDGTRGYRFSTYAFWWIKQAINRAITTKERMIRLPCNVEDNMMRANRSKTELAIKLGRVPSFEEMADDLEMNERSVRRLESTYLNVLSLDIAVGDEGKNNGSNLVDFIEDESQSDHYERLDTDIQLMQMQDALGMLTPNERFVIAHRYGLYGAKQTTFARLGLKMSLSKDAVRKLQHAAERKIRQYIEKSEGTPCSTPPVLRSVSAPYRVAPSYSFS